MDGNVLICTCCVNTHPNLVLYLIGFILLKYNTQLFLIVLSYQIELLYPGSSATD